MERRKTSLSDDKDISKEDSICPHCGGLVERCWIDCPEDDNCIYVSIQKHGRMTLDEISKRLNLSIVRISQIEKQALTKVRKRINII